MLEVRNENLSLRVRKSWNVTCEYMSGLGHEDTPFWGVKRHLYS